MVTTLDDLAIILRSKNAGPFYITIDAFFPDVDTYRRAAAPGVITVERVAEAYSLEPEEVLGVYRLETALGIKVSLRKRVIADDPANTDIMATQQHLPLAALTIPDP